MSFIQRDQIARKKLELANAKRGTFFGVRNVGVCKTPAPRLFVLVFHDPHELFLAFTREKKTIRGKKTITLNVGFVNDLCPVF